MSAQLQQSPMRLRAMRTEDLDQVAAIEQQAYPYPWTRGIFGDCLRVGYRCTVGLVSGRVEGYTVMSFGPGEAHLLNICVHPDCQGEGFGRQLLEHAVDEARIGGAGNVYLEVRPSNRPAVALYEAAGFREIGRRPRYYPADNGREDALVMARATGLEQAG